MPAHVSSLQFSYYQASIIFLVYCHDGTVCENFDTPESTKLRYLQYRTYKLYASRAGALINTQLRDTIGLKEEDGGLHMDSVPLLLDGLINDQHKVTNLTYDCITTVDNANNT